MINDDIRIYKVYKDTGKFIKEPEQRTHSQL